MSKNKIRKELSKNSDSKDSTITEEDEGDEKYKEIFDNS